MDSARTIASLSGVSEHQPEAPASDMPCWRFGLSSVFPRRDCGSNKNQGAGQCVEHSHEPIVSFFSPRLRVKWLSLAAARLVFPRAAGRQEDRDMSKDVRRILLEYGVAALAIGVAILVRWMIDPILGDSQPFCTLYGGVAVAVWYGGYRPALLATALGYLAVNYLFIGPRGSIEVKGLSAWVSLATYLLSGCLIIGFAEAMRSARRGLQKAKAKVQMGEAAVQAATQQLQVVTQSMAA